MQPVISILGELLLDIGGSMVLTQSNLPCFGEMLKRGTASTAKEDWDTFSTLRRAEDGTYWIKYHVTNNEAPVYL